ncbi:MAG: hypothetical protein ACK4WH_13195 [Phycisphaerales bacterium]
MNTHTPHPRFDTLFADPRHYRGDCRLMRTAIRRGWLNEAPQAVWDALVARFRRASDERRADDPEGRNLRATLAEIGVAVEMAGADQRAEHRALRYSWAGEPADRDTGRPRERWHVADCPNRIDANELRRRAKADGTDLRALRGGAVVVWPAGERVALAVVADARYGWRVWLLCPRCGGRRAHLYPVRAGVLCRKCAGVAYADGER